MIAPVVAVNDHVAGWLLATVRCPGCDELHVHAIPQTPGRHRRTASCSAVAGRTYEIELPGSIATEKEIHRD